MRRTVSIRILAGMFLLCLLVSCCLVPVSADDALYTDQTGQLKESERTALGSYLTRFGACYTAEGGDSSTHRYVFTDGWTDEMSQIIWWQFLSYSLRDQLVPNAAVAGNEKLVTPDDVQQAVYRTFGISGIPDGLYATSDSYYIAYLDGIWHAPQQDPYQTMWTRSPENCRIQFYAALPDGTYLVQYTLEYLQSALGTYDNTTYYAILRRADTPYGYVAQELGTTAALPQQYKDAGFLEDAKRGGRAEANLSFDYERVQGFSTQEEFADYLRAQLDTLQGEAPNGLAVRAVSTYIEAAVRRLAMAEVSAQENNAVLSADVLAGAAQQAGSISQALWELADTYGVTPEKRITVPLQVVVSNLNEASTPTVRLAEEAYGALEGVTRLDILLGDNQHRLTLTREVWAQLHDSYGNFSIQYGAAKRGGYTLRLYNQNGNSIETFRAPLTAAFPAQGQYDTVWYTHADGSEYNIGGQYDAQNQSIEISTKYAGRFQIEDNTPEINDIASLDDETQEAIRLLASKGYLSIDNGSFHPTEQYSKYDAALALSGMLFLRDPNAQTSYHDLSESDPQYMSVASVDQAQLDLYEESEDRRFSGISAVGLEAAYAKALTLLETYAGYEYPARSEDPELPYQSTYLNFPDLSFVKTENLDALALGVRQGLINDGMTLFANENQFTRAEAAPFLKDLSERFCETAPMPYNAEGQFLAEEVWFRPSAPRQFEVPPIAKVYAGCFGAGILGYIVLRLCIWRKKRTDTA